ncbi:MULTISPECIES: hypothetical protein [Microcystis]|jgi:hypothetical protein|uniref:Uncharacterized protein n=2 Tax=Microcystis TaxID=1125 RepID=A0A510PHB3_MICAE|nr:MULTISPECIES: hypothetical protein [Microcystis]MBD2623394.1 hypothetical protein [Microcystis flos-aquae FACHB-1344]MBE9071344.1 hypothetical protein [Microcystis sp. LEGE 08355]GCA93208.1 hypothetical protein MAE30S32_18600 [Microcystis aeruginosa 11-30S32]
MAKGFGTATKGHLGYVLLLCPTANAYAANHSLDGEGEEFIGVTNMLEMAQVWTKKNAAREAIIKYADFLIQQLEETPQVNIQIRSLKRLANGKLVTEVLEELTFEQNSASSR